MKVCRKCHAVHNGKKWVLDVELAQVANNDIEYVLCEACKRKRDKIVYGIVYLEGPVLQDRRDEILKMIKKEENIEKRHNHLSRILSIEQNKNHMTITTINQWMALQLGKQFKKAFKGKLEISRDASGRRGRGSKGREEVVVRWKQAA